MYYNFITCCWALEDVKCPPCGVYIIHYSLCAHVTCSISQSMSYWRHHLYTLWYTYLIISLDNVTRFHHCLAWKRSERQKQRTQLVVLDMESNEAESLVGRLLKIISCKNKIITPCCRYFPPVHTSNESLQLPTHFGSVKTQFLSTKVSLLRQFPTYSELCEYSILSRKDASNDAVLKKAYIFGQEGLQLNWVINDLEEIKLLFLFYRLLIDFSFNFT